MESRFARLLIFFLAYMACVVYGAQVYIKLIPSQCADMKMSLEISSREMNLSSLPITSTRRMDLSIYAVYRTLRTRGLYVHDAFNG